MRPRPIVLALGLAAAAPVGASEPRPAAAPPGNAETRYCMRVEAMTGSRIEAVRCWTRDEWKRQGVDVDADWPREGVRVVG